MERFKKIYQQGIVDVVEIWVDTQTGVNYVFTETEMRQDLPHCLTKMESQ